MKFSQFLKENSSAPGKYLAQFSTPRQEIESVISILSTSDFSGITTQRKDTTGRSDEALELSSPDYDELMRAIDAVQNKGRLDGTIAYLVNENVANVNVLPKMFKTSLVLSPSKITSLHNIHKHVNSVDGQIYVDGLMVTSSILGVLLIHGVKHVSFGGPYRVKNGWTLDEIMNKYLPNTRGNDAVFECQEELIDAGLDDFAKL